MALTQGAWSSKTVNKHLICTCTVGVTTAENDAYTLPTPKELNGKKPWTLFIVPAEDLDDAGAIVVDLWGGYADDFVLTGDSTTVAATSGAEIGNIISTDIKAGVVCAVRIVPANVGTMAAVTTVPGAVATVAPLPYYAINLDGASTFQDAADVTFVIVQ